MAQFIKDQLVGLDSRFRYRGLSQTRVETFSDAVFALAITLVVLSSSVPTTFEELRASMGEILPFFFCVILISIIWVQHYFFFLKYGLQNIRTIVFNTLLLFLVLVYVYPLKFLMRFLVQFYAGFFVDTREFFDTTFSDQPQNDMYLLMLVYGFGAMLIFFTLALLYRQAFKKREELDLNDYEIHITRISINTNLLLGLVPALSVIVTLIGGPNLTATIIAGFLYMLYPMIMPIYGNRARKKTKKLFG